MTRKIIAVVLMFALAAAAGSGQHHQAKDEKREAASSRAEQLQARISVIEKEIVRVDQEWARQMDVYRVKQEEAKEAERAYKAAEAKVSQERLRLRDSWEKLNRALSVAKAQAQTVSGFPTSFGMRIHLTNDKPATIDEKLDLILKRLEALEKKVERTDTTNKDKPISNWGNPAR